MTALAPDYQRIVNLLADHQRFTPKEAMGCQEIAAVAGAEVVAANSPRACVNERRADLHQRLLELAESIIYPHRLQRSF
ncbi:hypothetical protein OG871_34925 [Kitasatospora sp. NBC_00374]|uniref:hypothetical protein n=1 Tax=Kitasatospora sp. NBC_00374 TaxID=2975964 RepID=UPI00324A4327